MPKKSKKLVAEAFNEPKETRDLRDGMDFPNFLKCPQCKKTGTLKRDSLTNMSKCTDCGTGITDEYLINKYVKAGHFVDKNCKDPDEDDDDGEDDIDRALRGAP